MRFSAILRFTVHSPRGINFTLTTDEALGQIHRKYSKRWFGAKSDYVDLRAPSKEFLPFYFCSGAVQGTFAGSITYNESSGADSKQGSTTRTVSTGPHTLDSSFEENQTQVYAGYKYNMGYVQYALRNDASPLTMKKMSLVDTSGATINLFEQSTATLKEFVNDEVRRQATRTATEIVRSFHPIASSVSISFKTLEIRIEEVTPCFVPCYVCKASYDEEEYTLYVNGMNGIVGGPYLLNAVAVARVVGLSTATLGLMLTPNKVAGLVFGSFAGGIAYYAAYYAAKYFPRYRRDYFRKQRDKLRAQHSGVDSSGFRPSRDSRRTQQEYEHSSYWDSHKFQQRRTARRSSSSSSSSSSSPGGDGHVDAAKDSKGYYKTLGLTGNESVNEIRSAYRQEVLKQHPDVGGSTDKMARINEAYRVLRDPARRDEYDRT